MNTTLIAILLVLAFFLSWIAESKLRKKLLTELLCFQKNGDEKKYFAMLKSPVAVISLSTKARSLLGLDYYLAFSDFRNVSKSVDNLTEKNTNLDKDQDLLIRLMRSYIFFLEEDHFEAAKSLESYLISNCNLDEARLEIEELHQVYLAPSKDVLDELKKSLESAKEPQKRLIIYQRLAKVAELIGLKDQEKNYLIKMHEIAQKTIKMEEFKTWQN